MPPRLDGRVLVVDDTEAKRYLIAQTLRRAGMEVVEAVSGEAALAEALSGPDVVVLDVRLPDMSGFEVCRRLKEDPATSAIPVLYISALLQDEELEARLFDDGADGYIPQPIESRHLVAQTWALVRMRRAEQARQREREEAQAEQARLQRELEKTQSRARRLTESGLVGILYWDLDGSILEANDLFLEMMGYTREELERGLLDWRKLTPPEWAEQDEKSVAALRTQGFSGLYEKQYLRKDGARVDVMLGSAAFDGEPHRGVTMVVDLSERREAERQLKHLMAELGQGEARLRLALDSAELGAWSYDLVTGQHHWDTRAKELFGLPPEAPVDMSVWQAAAHPEDREWVSAGVRRALAGEGGGSFSAEYRTVGRRDGVLRWIASRGRVLFGVDGQPTHLSGTYLDITERKLNEQRAAELQATTAAFAHALTPAQVGAALVEHGLKSLDAYAGVLSLVEGEHLRIFNYFGYPARIPEAYSVVPLSLRSPSTLAALEGRTIAVQATDGLEREWPEFARTVQGSRSRTWLSTPLKLGDRVVGVLGLSFSSLRRFSAQEKAHLESLCGLCTQALERARLYEEERRAKDEARQRSELEQQYLGVVSHDLRNPLASISLGARTLQRLERPAPETVLRTAGRIATSADTMGRMVSDLLDFTRGRLGGGLPLERTHNDLVLLCQEVIEEFSVTHPERRILLEGDARCEGWWDGERMRQVLSNLLSNALRHSRPGSPVSVRARELEGEVELAVSNEGEPIPTELLPVLFEPFRRGLSTFRPAGSLGLGLFIVHQVVAGHGGRVEVGTGEEGTTFAVRVPRGAVPGVLSAAGAPDA
ncbi:PAS domain S-box-containing protein [Archangium gephyra]|uniref:histidine kinase n=1 Tax=Archangium gephyra TaxID=48 RepID=A0AAC8TAS9_9BACT|nr:hybrid sensor histidine kinase/response regulator [Archangium gephyra]AKI99081.1 Chemotaxis protein methyltransferase CheR [Archangium gephyra]REG30986.1 PAS domain S-box-containing protein [Archangium gephyra]